MELTKVVAEKYPDKWYAVYTVNRGTLVALFPQQWNADRYVTLNDNEDGKRYHQDTLMVVQVELNP